MDINSSLEHIMIQVQSDPTYANRLCTHALSSYELQTNDILLAHRLSDSLHHKKSCTKALSHMSAWLLIAHAENIATYVVNHSNERILLSTAVFGLSLASQVLDFRDILVLLSILSDAANRIGVSLSSICDDNTIKSLKILDFEARNPTDKNIESMGYTIRSENDGLFYMRK